jgi:hypothetical protein
MVWDTLASGIKGPRTTNPVHAEHHFSPWGFISTYYNARFLCIRLFHLDGEGKQLGNTRN